MTVYGGAAGVILLVDGTDPEALAVALGLHAKVADRTPGLPFIVALNKADLTGSWRLTDADLEPLRRIASVLHPTSALTGAGVQQLFHTPAPHLVPPRG